MHETEWTFETRVQALLGKVTINQAQLAAFHQSVQPELSLLVHFESLSRVGGEIFSVRVDGDCLEVITGSAIASNLTSLTSYTIDESGKLKIESLWKGWLDEYNRRISEFSIPV